MFKPLVEFSSFALSTVLDRFQELGGENLLVKEGHAGNVLHMISAADLRRQRRDLNRFRGTRETNLLGRVVVNGHEEMGSGSVVVTTDEATGGGRGRRLSLVAKGPLDDASEQAWRWVSMRTR